MHILDELTKEQLLELISANDLSTVKRLFSSDKRYEEILKKISLNCPFKKKKGTLALMYGMDIGVIVIDVWYAFISLVSMGALILISLTIMAAVVLGALATAAFFYRKYLLKNKEIESRNKLELLSLKMSAADLLMERLVDEIREKDHTQSTLSAFVPPFFVQMDKIKVSTSIASSVIVGFFTAMTISSSFFWGIVPIFELLGYAAFASALTGPWGIGIAMAILVGIGIFIACKHYQSSQNKAKLNVLEKKQTEHYNQQYSTCMALNGNLIGVEKRIEKQQKQSQNYCDENKPDPSPIPAKPASPVSTGGIEEKTKRDLGERCLQALKISNNHLPRSRRASVGDPIEKRQLESHSFFYYVSERRSSCCAGRAYEKQGLKSIKSSIK